MGKAVTIILLTPIVWTQAVPRGGDPLRRPEIIWATVALAAALFVGAFIIWMVDRWRKRLTRDNEGINDLTDYRHMLERGEITEEEYNKLRQRIRRPLRKDGSGRPADAGSEKPPLSPEPPAP